MDLKWLDEFSTLAMSWGVTAVGGLALIILGFLAARLVRGTFLGPAVPFGPLSFVLDLPLRRGPFVPTLASDLCQNRVVIANIGQF